MSLTVVIRIIMTRIKDIDNDDYMMTAMTMKGNLKAACPCYEEIRAVVQSLQWVEDLALIAQGY